MTTRLSSHDLEVALELRDLSGPAGGPHAMQALLDDVLVALTDQRANELRDQVYAAVHRGPRHEWAAR